MDLVEKINGASRLFRTDKKAEGCWACVSAVTLATWTIAQ